MIDLAQVQSTVLRGFRRGDALRYEDQRFVWFDNTAKARSWLAEIRPHLTSCANWDAQLPYLRATINVGFSHAGLRLLAGLTAPGTARARYAAFVEGAHARSTRTPAFGDIGSSAPPNWESHYRDADLHALVSVSASNPALLTTALATIDALNPPPKKIKDELGERSVGGEEHFGFVDGIGQPDVAGSGLPSLPGGGTPNANPGWDSIPSGEFVLGYPDALEHVFGDTSWLKNGSFLVFRKLHQDVALFRRYLQDLATRTGQSEALLAAKLVGRWRSGAPLVLAPSADDLALASDASRNNNFRYSGDDKGHACPVGAHIRRANSRDEPTGPTTAQTAQHRIVRRSIPYGTGLAPGSADDNQPRGLLFIAVNADIERQFEFVQANWINSALSSSALTLAGDKDPLIGAHDGTGKLLMPGASAPTFAWKLPRFVHVKGSAYFFLPSLDALKGLSEGTLAGSWPFYI